MRTLGAAPHLWRGVNVRIGKKGLALRGDGWDGIDGGAKTGKARRDGARGSTKGGAGEWACEWLDTGRGWRIEGPKTIHLENPKRTTSDTNIGKFLPKHTIFGVQFWSPKMDHVGQIFTKNLIISGVQFWTPKMVHFWTPKLVPLYFSL